MMMEYTDNYKTKVDIAYDYILNAIRSGAYKNNPRLNISAISNKLSLSETPVREALRKLQSQGLVYLSSNRGFFVKEVHLDNFKGYFEIMKLLEYYAASQSINNFDEETIACLEQINESVKEAGDRSDFITQREMNHKFHQFIVDNLNNAYLSNLFAAEQERYSVTSEKFYDLEYNKKRIYREHKEIIAALKKKDLSSLEEILTRHKRGGLNNLVKGFGMIDK